MYDNTIQNLVNNVGEAFMLENIPKYIIQISTNIALNRSAFSFNMADTLPVIVNKLNLNEEFVKLDSQDEMLYVIENLSRCDIKYDGFDYLIISNAGKYNVILKLNGCIADIEDNVSKCGGCKDIEACNNKDVCLNSKSLYLDIHSIRIDMVDKKTTDNLNYYSNIFNYGFNTCISFLTFRYFYSDLYRNVINSTLGFFRYIGSSFQNRINSVAKIS